MSKKQDFADLVNQIKPVFEAGSIEFNNGRGTGTSDVYTKALELGGTNVDEAKRVGNANMAFITAGIEVVGKRNVDHLGNNKDLDEVSTRYDMAGVAHADFRTKREAIVRTPPKEKGGEAVETTVFGQTRSVTTFGGAKPNSGIKQAASAVLEYGQSKLG